MNKTKDIKFYYDNKAVFFENINFIKEREIKFSIYTPYYIEELDKYCNNSQKSIGYIGLIMGVLGLFLSAFFIWYTSFYSWNVQIALRSNSFFENLPAFFFIVFEVTILFASLGIIYKFYRNIRKYKSDTISEYFTILLLENIETEVFDKLKENSVNS